MDWVKRKGTTGNDLRGLCAKNREIVIIPHNLTNKFQSLDPGVSKAAKTYVFEKRNTQTANKISKQLKKDIAPPDVKVSLRLSVIKPLHAKWIVDLYHHLKADKEMIVNGFRTAGIFEAIENAQVITEKVENPFKELQFFKFFLTLAFFKAKIKKAKAFLQKENVLCTFFHLFLFCNHPKVAY